MSKKPNVVFFLTDDQRFDTICALGDQAVRTPHLDRLVGMGTSFTHAFIPGGTSGAVCMPSRAMLNTGRTLFRLKGAGGEIPEDHALLGETLRQSGYHTFGTGKWHNGPRAYERSFSDGAEIFFGGMADHWNMPSRRFDPTGRYDTPVHIQSGRHSTDLLGGAAVDFLSAYDGAAPYYLYLSFLAPHDPRTMPEKYRAMYDPARIALPPNFLGNHPFDNGELHIRDEQLAGFPRTPEEVRQHLADYYAMISHLDDRIGEVMAAVEARGELDNTIFVLAGDNGLAVGQHGLFGKQSLYEHSVRVPLVFAGPDIPRNSRTDAMVYLLDIFPTLCELTGTAVPGSVEGESLLPAMTGTASGRDALYLAYTDLHRGVRTKECKLIEYVVGGAHTMTQLFDMRRNPWETNNLAADPSRKATIAELRAKLLELREAWGDEASEWGTRFWRGYLG